MRNNLKIREQNHKTTNLCVFFVEIDGIFGRNYCGYKHRTNLRKPQVKLGKFTRN